MNSEPELITKSDDEFDCLACGNKFTSAGALIPKEVKTKAEVKKLNEAKAAAQKKKERGY